MASYFQIVGQLDSSYLTQPSANVSFLETANGVQLLDYSQSLVLTFDTSGAGLVIQTDAGSMDPVRVALDAPELPGSVAPALYDYLLGQAAEPMQTGAHTFLGLGAWTGNAATLIVTETAGGRFLYGAGPSGQGISVFQAGDLEATYQGHVAGGAYDTGISALASVSTAQGDFLFTGSALEHGVDVYRIGADGTPVPVYSVGVDELLPVQTISALVPIEVSGNTYLLVAAAGSSSLTVLAVGADGSLAVTDHMIDSLDSRFANVTQLETFSAGGHQFVLAAGSDDGISLFTVLPNGSLVHLQSLADGIDTTLANISGMSVQVSGDQAQILVVSGAEAGLTQLTLDLSNLGIVDSASDVMNGTAARDMLAISGAGSINGSGGDDILHDGQGENTLSGGEGADLFVLVADGMRDTIIDFELGMDRLDLSFWPFLRNLSQITFIETANGAILRFGDEELVLISADGQPISAEALPDMFLGGPSRLAVELSPPGGPSAGADDLTGTTGADDIDGLDGDDRIQGLAGNDYLRGGGGGDTITGGAGNDRVEGGLGDDTLDGGAGFDTLDGGDGADTLIGGFQWDTLTGGAGNDLLQGDGGDDTLNGDAGDDRLEGGEGRDTLNGGDGADTLLGGAHDDTLNGGAGNDRLLGGWQNDTLNGDDGNDTLYGEWHNDTLYGGLGNDTLDGGSGNDRLFGGTGNDILTGGADHDTFVFADGFGQDVITDFDALDTAERIKLTDVSTINNMSDLLAAATQSGSDVVIDAGGGNVLTLENVTLADLDGSDFIF